MQYITTTQLRTMSTDLIAALSEGYEIDLFHRSRKVGKIVPDKYPGKVFTKKSAEDLKKLAEKMNLPKLSQKQLEKNYRDHMARKYGKNISRH